MSSTVGGPNRIGLFSGVGESPKAWDALLLSELVGIGVEDLTDNPEGLIVHLPRSKTDQEGARPGQLFADSAGAYFEGV